MEFPIAREIPGRLRVALAGPIPDGDLGPLSAYLDACPDITAHTLYGRIGSLAVTYAPGEEARARVLAHLDALTRAVSAVTLAQK